MACLLTYSLVEDPISSHYLNAVAFVEAFSCRRILMSLAESECSGRRETYSRSMQIESISI